MNEDNDKFKRLIKKLDQTAMSVKFIDGKPQVSDKQIIDAMDDFIKEDLMKEVGENDRGEKQYEMTELGWKAYLHSYGCNEKEAERIAYQFAHGNPKERDEAFQQIGEIKSGKYDNFDLKEIGISEEQFQIIKGSLEVAEEVFEDKYNTHALIHIFQLKEVEEKELEKYVSSVGDKNPRKTLENITDSGLAHTDVRLRKGKPVYTTYKLTETGRGVFALLGKDELYGILEDKQDPYESFGKFMDIVES